MPRPGHEPQAIAWEVVVFQGGQQIGVVKMTQISEPTEEQIQAGVEVWAELRKRHRIGQPMDITQDWEYQLQKGN